MRRTVAILNQKGGVGKTTVTLGFASAAATARRRVLVVDLDPQAASSWVLGLDPGELESSVSDVLVAERLPIRSVVRPSAWSEYIDVLPAAGDLQELESGRSKRLRKALAAVENEYEAVLIDCPPSLGNLTRSALNAAGHALIVVEPSALGLRGIGGVADLVDDVWDVSNPDLELAGVVLNRVPAVSNEAERALSDRRARSDLGSEHPATGDLQPGPRRAAGSALIRQSSRRSDRRVRRTVAKASRGRPRALIGS